jgi:hypothetical protein
MDGAKLIERIRLKNILSFGEEGQEIAIGPNSYGTACGRWFRSETICYEYR